MSQSTVVYIEITLLVLRHSPRKEGTGVTMYSVQGIQYNC